MTSLGSRFWRLFAASAGSNLSDGLLTAAVPLLAATLTRDPMLISLVASLVFLPWLLFAVPAGVLIDRLNRRRAMAIANAARATVLATLATLIVSDALSLPWLYALSFAGGIAEVVYDTAARAMLPNVVRADQLERGNSLLSIAEHVGNLFVGAPLGALLFALAPTWPFAAATLGYVACAVLVASIRGEFQTERETKSSFYADMVEGTAWLAKHPVLRPLVFTSAMAAFGVALANGVLVLFALDALDLSEAVYGVLLACAGVGGILGALASPMLSARFGRAASMGSLTMLAGAGYLAAGLTVAWPIASGTCLVIAATSVAAFNVQVLSVRQALIPDALLGRVQGAYRMVLWGSIPIGYVTGGLVAGLVGLPMAYVVAGAITVVAGVITWSVLVRHREMVDSAFEPDIIGPECET